MKAPDSAPMDSVTILGSKGGPAIRPGSAMPTSILVRMDGKPCWSTQGWGRRPASAAQAWP